MLGDFAVIVLGLIGLFVGGELLIRSASRLATALGTPTLIVGLTIIAFGTSTPELVVSMSATLSGMSEIVLGNVIGSNIANIGLILGIAGSLRPLTIHISLIQREIPIMIAVAGLAILMALDGEISSLEGMVLVLGYGVFTYLIYRFSPKETQATERDYAEEVSAVEGQSVSQPQAINRIRELGLIVVSLAILVAGAQFTVTGAVNIARVIGISEFVIGITLVAVGTSLPEIVTSIMAVLRGHNDIAAGNVVGSNIANVLVILGMTALIHPIHVPTSVLSFDLLVMLGFMIALVPFVLNRTLARWQAAVLLMAYTGFVAYTVIAATAI